MESSLHAIRGCTFASGVWKSVVPMIAWGKFFRLAREEWLVWNIRNDGNLSTPDGKWSTLYSILCLFIWKNRNSFISRQSIRNIDDLISSAKIWSKSLGAKDLAKQWAC